MLSTLLIIDCPYYERISTCDLASICEVSTPPNHNGKRPECWRILGDRHNLICADSVNELLSLLTNLLPSSLIGADKAFSPAQERQDRIDYG